MPPSRSTITSSDDARIVTYRWAAENAARGIVQLTHGMGEHVLRYQPLADELTAHGFVVVGQDHRGHGASAASPQDYGRLGDAGWDGLVADIGLVSRQARDVDPGLPLVLLGHSMGSFAAQQYVLGHSADIDALALTGSAVLDLLEPALNLDAPIDLSMFNSPFTPARTEFDWLSRDEEQVDMYIADPMCGFGLDTEAGKQMFVSARPLADPARLAAMRTDLPVYIASGERDPVHGQLTLLSPLLQRYATQFEDVTAHIYPDARHEVFNETNRAEVVADLLAWLERIVPAA